MWFWYKSKVSCDIIPSSCHTYFEAYLDENCHNAFGTGNLCVYTGSFLLFKKISKRFENYTTEDFSSHNIAEADDNVTLYEALKLITDNSISSLPLWLEEDLYYAYEIHYNDLVYNCNGTASCSNNDFKSYN